MTINFNELKKKRQSSFESITKEIEKLSSNKFDDEPGDFWSPTVDKAGNGFAIIRFLPAPPGEDTPFVRLFSHGFKGPTGLWYIENSLTTLGQKDPVSEYNSQLWNSVSDDNAPERKQVRNQKRRLTYISNILVVKDPANPENEGKVFLFKYGKKIWDKIHGAMYPEFEDEKPMNPFDLWDGANFKLKIRKVEGYRNYDKSEFESSEPVSHDDDELEKIWKSEQPLAALIAPDRFKTYEELERHLMKVLGGTAQAAIAAGAGKGSDLPVAEEYTPPAAAAPASYKSTEADSSDESSRSDNKKFDSDLEYFSSLAGQEEDIPF